MVRTDDNWQEWEFWQFIETLRKWTDRNLILLEDKRKVSPTKRERLYQTSQDDWNPNACVYCSKKDHKSSDSKIVTKVKNCKKILSKKRLCFNRTGVKCRAAECRSKRTFQTCRSKHQSSLCKQTSTMMVATEGSAMYPRVFFKVNNITCIVLLNNGAGASRETEYTAS